jgi:uncharacterized membrane protein YdbT with pleckstrin-like domain
MPETSSSQSDERILYRAHLHWSLFAPPLALFLAGLVAVAFHAITAIALLVASIAAIVAAYAKYATTQIVVTDSRIVYRTGLLARRSMEMNRDKIESIDVSQSVLGRLLDFGAVAIKGTGGGIEAINNIGAPVVLRNHVAARGSESGWLPGISEPMKS